VALCAIGKGGQKRERERERKEEVGGGGGRATSPNWEAKT